MQAVAIGWYLYDLTGEAIRLGRLLRSLLPDDGEVTGLLALMLLAEARRPARVSDTGELVTLDASSPLEAALHHSARAWSRRACSASASSAK